MSFTASHFLIDVRYSLGGAEMLSRVGFQFSIAQPEMQNLRWNSVQGSIMAKILASPLSARDEKSILATLISSIVASIATGGGARRLGFDPVLDELFGLTNNKQEVRN